MENCLQLIMVYVFCNDFMVGVSLGIFISCSGYCDIYIFSISILEDFIV